MNLALAAWFYKLNQIQCAALFVRRLRCKEITNKLISCKEHISLLLLYEACRIESASTEFYDRSVDLAGLAEILWWAAHATNRVNHKHFRLQFHLGFGDLVFFLLKLIHQAGALQLHQILLIFHVVNNWLQSSLLHASHQPFFPKPLRNVYKFLNLQSKHFFISYQLTILKL